jgi:hypothetical protein
MSSEKKGEKERLVPGHYRHDSSAGVSERPTDLINNPDEAIISRLDGIIEPLEKIYIEVQEL